MPFPKSLRLPAAIAFTLGLAACQGMPEPPAAIGTPAPTAQSLAPVTADGQATFAFEPFTGAPGNIADELSRALGSEARSQGLVLVRRVGAPSTYRVNGYLSASGEPSSATVFYVFDIVDNTGQRLKRISGTERISGASGDPWQGADSGALNRIASRTTVEMAAWLNRR
ncbi:hypothetical protein [Roseibium sp.]|uniref:hypothetical protein n=1 Tax=Roseibium sp. TaxID=1936156 RepID=UPI003A97C8C5